ncbi:sugar ABC transporter permease [soil metagenome]
MVSLEAGIKEPVVVTTKVERSRLSIKHREMLSGYLFILPAVLGFIAWTAGPMVYSAWMSLHEWNLIQPAKYVGLDNFREIWHDDLFWQSLKVTFKYAAILVPVFQIVSLLTAMLLNTNVRGVTIYRAAFYLPTVVPVAAASFLWGWIFNPEFGLLNHYLRELGFSKILWFQDPQWALTAMVSMSVWTFGGTMVIYLAGLQGIPQHLYEAAEIDGATAWRKFVNVTLPMMSPVIFFNLVLGVIGALQAFTSAYIITDGGPQNGTLFYTLYIFRKGFTDSEMGYASALAWVLFAIVLVLSVFVFRSFGRMVYYEDEGR